MNKVQLVRYFMHFSSFASMSWREFFKALETMEENNLLALVEEGQDELVVGDMAHQLLFVLVRKVEQAGQRIHQEREANF